MTLLESLCRPFCQLVQKVVYPFWPIDQQKQQRLMEDCLFDYCDDLQHDEIGMHWSFDWLFASREAFALSVGRFFEPNRDYCHVTFRHQSNNPPSPTPLPPPTTTKTKPLTWEDPLDEGRSEAYPPDPTKDESESERVSTTKAPSESAPPLQSNETTSALAEGSGLVYEVRLPRYAFRLNLEKRTLIIDYKGDAEVQCCRLHHKKDPAAPLPHNPSGGSSPLGKIPFSSPKTPPPSEEIPPQGWVQLKMEKTLWQPGESWSNKGEFTLWDRPNGRLLTHWTWDYRVETVVDRPDYDDVLFLWLLQLNLIPSGNGHFIPAMRAQLAAGSHITYQEKEGPRVDYSIEGAYLDGNFGRSRRLDHIVSNRWGWMAAPQLWTTEGVPTNEMMTFGFFHKPLIRWLQGADAWSGAILWRSNERDMTRFALCNLLDHVEVRHHSPDYLDITITPFHLRHRLTIRAWSETMTTPLCTPSGRRFQDHQDLLADAYVVIEENLRKGNDRYFRPPQWTQIARRVTNLFGFEFGEQVRVMGVPDYPAYDAIPPKPPWFLHALKQIPSRLGSPLVAHRLHPLNHP